jgi:hypothetical protein
MDFGTTEILSLCVADISFLSQAGALKRNEATIWFLISTFRLIMENAVLAHIISDEGLELVVGTIIETATCGDRQRDALGRRL